MKQDPVNHTIKRQISNMEMENRDSLVNLYLNQYKLYHPEATYATLNKRIKEANPDVDWGKLKLGQHISIPMDIPPEEPQKETQQETSEFQTKTSNTTEEEVHEDHQEKNTGKPNKAGIYPVCNGAQCMCDQSKEKIPDLFKVLSHNKVYVNDAEGATKLLGTTNDLPLPFEKPSNTFGTCLKQPIAPGQYKPCIPNITQWEKSYEAIKVPVANNATALIQESEGICSFGGTITFDTHGQTQTITQADVEETSPEVAQMINPLLDEEIVQKLQTGTFDDTDEKGVGVIDIETTDSQKPKGGKNGTYIYHDEHKQIQFKASKFSQSKVTDKQKAGINWVVYEKKKNNTYKELYTFVDQGDVFDFPYRTAGIYAVEAYGKSKTFNISTGKGGAYNLVHIKYQELANSLKLTVDGQDRTGIKRIRPTETASINAGMLFPDATPLKPKNIYWEVTSGGKDLEFIKVKGVAQITIPPQGNTKTMTVTVKANCNGITTNPLTFKVGNNYVKAINANKETIAILEESNKNNPKDRHKVTFTVTEFAMPYNPVLDANMVVQWCVYDQKTKQAKQQLATARDTSKVSASVKAQATKHTLIKTQGNQQVINPAKHTYTGTSAKEGTWYVEAFAQNPTGNNATSKPITAIMPKITKAYWANKDGNPISKSGLEHEVYIHIETEGLVGEKLQLKVWESQKGKDKYIENAGTEIEITQNNGTIHQAFTLPKEAPGISENYKYEFFFTLEKLVFKVKNTQQDPQVNNQYILIPKGKPHYLHVDSNKKITSLKIYESNGKLHTGIIKYGDTVTIKVETRNLVGESLEFKIYEDIKIDNYTDAYSTYDTWDDKPMHETITIKINKDGTGETPFTVPKTWEAKHTGIAEVPRYFYLKYGNSEFPRNYYITNPNQNEEENKKNSNRILALMLKTAKTLPLKEYFETTNAVILGEELKFEQDNGEACDPLIWGSKDNSEFVTCSFRKRVIEIAKNLGLLEKDNQGANWLMAVMALETGGTFDPSITNNLGYTGLIQFGKSAAERVGTTRDKLKKMTALEQLDYVEKYLNNYKSKLKTITDVYLSVLYPKASGHGEEKNYVVFDDSKKAYKANPTFFYEDDEVDKDSNGKIIKRHGKTGGKTYIWEVKMAIESWYSRGVARKNTCKIDTSTCEFGSSAGNQTSKNGVLEEMKKLVDKHIPYSQLGERASLGKEGMKELDCSETVGIYLHKLGVMPNYVAIHTGVMTTQSDFRKAIGSQNIDLVSGSTKSDFKPQRGDIFVWRSGNGHTGIVYKYDESSDLVTILEAIGSVGARGESQQVANGGDPKKGCTRTAIYKRTSSALFNHPGWKGYFRPKNYTKKL